MEYISVPRLKYEQMERQVKEIDEILKSKHLIHKHTEYGFCGGDYLVNEFLSSEKFESEIVNSLNEKISILEKSIKDKNKVIRKYYFMKLFDRIFRHNDGVDYVFKHQAE